MGSNTSSDPASGPTVLPDKYYPDWVKDPWAEKHWWQETLGSRASRSSQNRLSINMWPPPKKRKLSLSPSLYPSLSFPLPLSLPLSLSIPLPLFLPLLSLSLSLLSFLFSLSLSLSLVLASQNAAFLKHLRLRSVRVCVLKRGVLRRVF